MKTTVEIPEPLLREAQAAAREDRTTLKALIEAGLRVVLAHRASRQTFVLRDASVAGNGRQPEFREARWDHLREAIYDST